MSLTVADITSRVQRQFGDEANAQISQTDIIRWINDVVRDIAHKNKLFQTKATSDGVRAQSAYELPASISKLYSVKYNGIALQQLSIAEADAFIGSIDLTNAQGFPTGTPTHYWVWGDQINIYPAPDTDTAGALIAYYTKAPTQVTAGGDTVPIPDEYHNIVTEYCLAKAYELDENFEVSQRKLAQVRQDTSENNDTSWESQESYPFITSTPDDSDLMYYG